MHTKLWSLLILSKQILYLAIIYILPGGIYLGAYLYLLPFLSKFPNWGLLDLFGKISTKLLVRQPVMQHGRQRWFEFSLPPLRRH